MSAVSGALGAKTNCQAKYSALPSLVQASYRGLELVALHPYSYMYRGGWFAASEDTGVAAAHSGSWAMNPSYTDAKVLESEEKLDEVGQMDKKKCGRERKTEA